MLMQQLRELYTRKIYGNKQNNEDGQDDTMDETVKHYAEKEMKAFERNVKKNDMQPSAIIKEKRKSSKKTIIDNQMRQPDKVMKEKKKATKVTANRNVEDNNKNKRQQAKDDNIGNPKKGKIVAADESENRLYNKLAKKTYNIEEASDDDEMIMEDDYDGNQYNKGSNDNMISRRKMMEGTKLKIPFFDKNNSWNWDRYLSPNIDYGTRPKRISKNYLPYKRAVEDKDALARLEYLNKPKTERNVSIAKKQIEDHLANIKGTMKSWLTRFLVDFSRYMGIYAAEDGDGELRGCRNENDFRNAILACTTFEDVKRFFRLLYLVFDFMPDIGKKFESMILQEYRLEIYDEVTIWEEKDDEKNKSCIELLYPCVLWDIRKSYLSIIKKRFGVTFTVKRSPEHVEMMGQKWQRLDYHEYPWMYVGNFVSNIGVR
jgi:hypothetical protein